MQESDGFLPVRTLRDRFQMIYGAAFRHNLSNASEWAVRSTRGYGVAAQFPPRDGNGHPFTSRNTRSQSEIARRGIGTQAQHFPLTGTAVTENKECIRLGCFSRRAKALLVAIPVGEFV